MNFDHHADRVFFASLFCGGDVALLEERFGRFFDFRAPAVKRAEFNRMRPEILVKLIEEFGQVCMLRFPSLCKGGDVLQVDHLIPLSSNILNKTVRHLPAKSDKKVETQSFGSNDLSNLVLACPQCNAFKKHRLPDVELVERILREKGIL